MPSSYLTLSGYKKLLSELEYLRTIKRPEIAALLRDSVGNNEIDGDIDPDFVMAKDQQAFIEGRIQELETLLSDPDIIDYHQHSNIVEIGSRVTISELGNEPVSYTIVGPVEAAPEKGLISFASPLGSALIGRSVGDEVVIKSPGGIYTVSLLEVI
ncbi:MAG: transcription elongation factor GreA [Chloroflexota bacterium]|nr:MAG: transcription elongation factor GreA [Chloroflexota bacterium]